MEKGIGGTEGQWGHDFHDGFLWTNYSHRK